MDDTSIRAFVCTSYYCALLTWTWNKPYKMSILASSDSILQITNAACDTNTPCNQYRRTERCKLVVQDCPSQIKFFVFGISHKHWALTSI